MNDVLQVISSPRRREILRLVWVEERAAGEIQRALGDVTFGAVSQHLRVLKQADLLTCRVSGRHRYYRANQDAVGSLRPWLENLWDSALYRLQLLAELEQARRGPRATAPREQDTPSAGPVPPHDPTVPPGDLT